MITIGICDDDQKYIDDLFLILSDVMKQISDWQPRTFHSGSEVLASIENGDFDCNLLFMDIFMEGTNGIDAAKYIYEHQIDTDIIFITSSKDYVFECYHYNTFAYLLKPLSKVEISNELLRYLEELKLNPKYLNIAIKGYNYKIPINSILYIESTGRKVIVHTTKKEYSYYQKLDVLEDLLKNEGFARCHQSYLVPINKLDSYNISELMIGDISIPISRKYQKNLKALFTAHKEAAASNEPGCFISSSLNRNQTTTGAFVCTKGAYIGAIIRIKPEQKIIIGRDGSVADMIVNLPLVSRSHCAVTFHAEENEYEIVDFSNNGTFVNGDKRLVKDEKYILKPGTELCFGDKETIYKLG